MGYHEHLRKNHAPTEEEGDLNAELFFFFTDSSYSRSVLTQSYKIWQDNLPRRRLSFYRGSIAYVTRPL